MLIIMDKEDLHITADLARIELREGEIDRLAAEVGQMLEYFQMMAQIPVDGLEPTTHALVKGNQVRPDLPGSTDDGLDRADDLLERAPELEDRFLVIPNVL